MAETLVEKKVCGECGAEVRPQTSFCYNCGKSVTETPDRDPADEPSSIWFGETIISDGPGTGARAGARSRKTRLPKHSKDPSLAEPAVDPLITKLKRSNVKISGLKISKLETAPGPDGPDVLDPIHHSLPVESGMRSAASIRRKAKTYQRREVEIVWEEHEGKSNLKYILITLLVVLFTVIVFWIAMTIK